jgi:hypothetical protein
MKKTAIILTLAFISLAGGYMLNTTPAAAQSHADICQANYDQCINGCAGAQSCSNQCQVNKDGCNSQGQ